MSNDLCKATMVGRMVRDPELKQTRSGKKYCIFTIAVNRTTKSGNEKREDVSFFRWVAWEGLADIISKYAGKGKLVLSHGRPNQREWQDQNGNRQSIVEFVAEEFQILTPKGSGNANQTGQYTGNVSNNQQNSAPMYTSDYNDDDIPF